jgi:hypothetical protein
VEFWSGQSVFVMSPNCFAAASAAAGMHHASRAVKQQALSKRAMLRMPGTAAAAAAGQHGGTKAAAAAGLADGNLLDSATGAFVHGVEDDVVQVGDGVALELQLLVQQCTAQHALQHHIHRYITGNTPAVKAMAAAEW